MLLFWKLQLDFRLIDSVPLHHGRGRFLPQMERLPGDKIASTSLTALFQGSITTSLGALRTPLSSLQVQRQHSEHEIQLFYFQPLFHSCLDSTFQDVTLQCGGHSVKAHRLVLALCR